MQKKLELLKSLNRPSLLVKTARSALANFRRDTLLPRILGYDGDLDSQFVLSALLDRESELNEQRKSGDAGYSIARHIAVLTALMAEANRVQHAQMAPM